MVWPERWAGQNEQEETQQKWGEMQGEQDDGHSGQGCRVYTNSVHSLSARGKASRLGREGLGAGLPGWAP